MKNLIIIGAGGMGRSVYCIAQGCHGYNTEFQIKGFLDDDPSQLDCFKGYPPILGKAHEYIPEKDDVFVCSLGSTQTKMEICEDLKKRGGCFITLIHKTAIVRQNSQIGDGCIIADYASVGSDCSIGDNCLLQSFAIVGHDCLIGNYVRIDTHVTCVGGVVVEDLATIHTSAVVSHKVRIGRGATIAALSFVIKKVGAGSTVYGNPAKKLI